MSLPQIGINFRRIEEELRPAILSNMSVAGLVGWADDADPVTFPLNTPVLVNSNDAVKLTALGAAGSLPATIRAINNQLSGFQSAAACVVVRVDKGATLAEQCANIQGAQVSKTGIWALLEAPALLGLTPRLINVSGITGTIETASIGLINALPPVLERLRAHAVVDLACDTYANYIAARNQVNSQRIIPVSTNVREMVNGVEVTSSGAAAVLGVGISVDHQHSGVPTRSWANQPIQGIVGTERPIAFSLTDGDCEGQQLLAANGGIIIRGSVGVEDAISSGGYTYLGTDNLGNDDVWRFYNQTRMRDFMELTMLRTLRYFLGRFNLNLQVLTNIKRTMENFLLDMKANQYILDFAVYFPKGNSVDAMRLGQFKLDFKAEEPPPIRLINIGSARYREAMANVFGALITSATNPNTTL